MTTYHPQTQVCCICGTSNECSVIGSTNTLGAPDLDLRPAEMERSTMHAWFHQCKNCHYVSVDLSRETQDAKSIVDSTDYQELMADSEIPEVAKRFVACSLLNAKDREISGVALLRAAWDCDDHDKPDMAKAYREQSADLLRQLQPFEDQEEQATIGVMLIDVLRRAARFEEANKLADQMLKFKTVKRSPAMLAVVKFQKSLCESQSIERHTIDEAMKTDG